jgi:hypothetical protein
MSTRIMGRRFGAVAVLLLCAMAMQTRAATITVTNTNDSGSGSLRQALMIANDGDTINFAVTGTITLTSGLLVAKNVTISGPGADQLAIDGNGNQATFVFGIFPGKTVTISGLTIRNGQVGIWNQGTLTVSNCAVSVNSAVGLLNDHATVSVSNCIVSGNSLGGLSNDASHGPNQHTFDVATMTITNSVVSDNSGTGVSNTGNLTIVNSTLTGNSVAGDLGGGIRNGSFKTPGTLVTVLNSTISGNSAQDGGGIFSEYGFLSIVNSTISGNSAAGGGGGIANFAGAVQIANSTISGNSAPQGGGGISNIADQFGAATIETGNTIFEAGASGENIFNDGGTVTSHGYNICSDNGGGYLNGPNDQINTDPLLGPLQDNGGPTLTHEPLPGSPAIDAGDPNFTPPPFYDQRGRCFHRVFGRRIDVGSVEVQPPRCVTPAPRPTPHSGQPDAKTN